MKIIGFIWLENIAEKLEVKHNVFPEEVEIKLSSDKMYCPIATDLLRQVRTQARRQGVSTETLINLWLQEKLLEEA